MSAHKFALFGQILMAAFLSVVAVGGPATAASVPFTNFRAAWVSTNTYNPGAVVTYNGASYFCLVANTGIKPNGAPTSATDWAILDAPGTLVDANGNTAEGQNALSVNAAGQNTAFGNSALAANTIGHGNTASGFLALGANTTGGLNTASGDGALYANTTGNANTASGVNALSFNTSGYDNTASGFDALQANTIGYSNTASGFGALQQNTTGTNNIAVGFQAGRYLTTGNYNIDIGNPGVAAESGTIRIGTVGNHTNAYFAGIKTNLTADSAALPVVVDTVTGQLGTGSLVMGPVGPQGPQGPPGATGARGTTGATGAAGATGLQGVAGPAGPQGPQGAAGVTGPQGTAGTNGTNGIGFTYSPTYISGTPYVINNVVTEAGTAYVALTNNTGVDPATDVSASGGNWAIFAAAGTPGPAGPAGAIGPAGATGPLGPQGYAGAQGLAGVPGPSGPVGPGGATGAAGPQGLQGAQGPQGTSGAQGLQGPAGAAGAGLPATCASGDVAVFYNSAWTCQSALPRYVVNGDGTVTDNRTGLMWEMHTSTCSGEVTCYTNTYTWTSTGTLADGTLFTSFIPGLNGGDYYSPATGQVVNAAAGSCFANHCDWRIPTIAELRTIIELTAAGCGSGTACIDLAFGPTQAIQCWSSSSLAGFPDDAWVVAFSDGNVYSNGQKPAAIAMRAVRGGR